MRLMTFNILTGGVDAGDPARLAHICELVRGVRPDLLVLQECNGFERHGFRTLYQLERELGMRGVFVPSSTGYSVSFFSRVGQLLETEGLDDQMHHTAIVATLLIGGERVRIIGAHLCPFGGETRIAEVQHLLRYIGKEHVFVVGDLNALSPRDAGTINMRGWLPRRRARHQLAGGGGSLDTRAISALEDCELVDTFHARLGASAPATCQTRLRDGSQDYQVRIDYIFATAAANERVLRCERVDGPLADSASDHYALFIDAQF
jgi:exodeoxyribonuclease-3